MEPLLLALCGTSGPVKLLNSSISWPHDEPLRLVNRIQHFLMLIFLLHFSEEVLTSLVVHNRSFLPLPGSVLAPGMSQDQAVPKPKRILSGKLFTQGLIYDLWDLRHKSLGDRRLFKKNKQNEC